MIEKRSTKIFIECSSLKVIIRMRELCACTRRPHSLCGLYLGRGPDLYCCWYSDDGGDPTFHAMAMHSNNSLKVPPPSLTRSLTPSSAPLFCPPQQAQAVHRHQAPGTRRQTEQERKKEREKERKQKQKQEAWMEGSAVVHAAAAAGCCCCCCCCCLSVRT